MRRLHSIRLEDDHGKCRPLGCSLTLNLMDRLCVCYREGVWYVEIWEKFMAPLFLIYFALYYFCYVRSCSVVSCFKLLTRPAVNLDEAL